MINAIPDVKPVITGAGINAMNLPNLSSPIISRNTPEIKPAIQTPCRPYFWASTIKTALMAPVGPLIWKGAPESDPMTNPAITAVTRPAEAVAPDATPKASANGRATAATVNPANKSC